MTKPPYDPDALPPSLRKLLPLITAPARNYLVTPECPTKPVLQKSSAQVESWVSPKVVSPNSCGLKPKKRKRRNPLTVRLSDRDRGLVWQKAKAAGCSLNAYVRASVLGSDYLPPKDPELVQILRKYYFELYKQGINLNQIAKQLNGGSISPDQGQTLLDDVASSMSQMHRAVLGALAHGKMGDQ